MPYVLEYPTDQPFVSVIVSTNDCWPGCGCERDRFHINAFRIYRWIKHVGVEKAEIALEQLRDLEQFTEHEFCTLSNFINIHCGINKLVHAEFIELASKSESMLSYCLHRINERTAIDVKGK